MNQLLESKKSRTTENSVTNWTSSISVLAAAMLLIMWTPRLCSWWLCRSSVTPDPSTLPPSPTGLYSVASRGCFWTVGFSHRSFLHNILIIKNCAGAQISYIQNYRKLQLFFISQDKVVNVEINQSSSETRNATHRYVISRRQFLWMFSPCNDFCSHNKQCRCFILQRQVSYRCKNRWRDRGPRQRHSRRLLRWAIIPSTLISIPRETLER